MYDVKKTHFALILTHKGKLSHNHEAEKSLSYKNTAFMPQWVHLLHQDIMHLTAKVYLKSCQLGCH